MHQILTTDKYIFSITSSFDRLYRKQFHRERISNEVNQILVFKRVQPENFSRTSLYGTRAEKVYGNTTPYLDARYDVYTLGINNSLRGYMITPKRGIYSYQEDPRQRIYYEFERKER